MKVEPACRHPGSEDGGDAGGKSDDFLEFSGCHGRQSLPNMTFDAASRNDNHLDD